MKKFEHLVESYYSTLLEQDAPAAPAPTAGAAPAPAPDASATASALPGMDGGVGGSGSMGGEGGGASSDASSDLDNKSKREADPREYTKSILTLLVDKTEGVTPEMFDDYIDTVSLGLTKVRNKEGFKKFYGDFYRKVQLVLSMSDELKSMFKQLSGTMEDLVGAQEEPDSGGGGVGRAGPSGPGV